MPKHEFLGVDQRPCDVLQRGTLSSAIGSILEKREHDLAFRRSRAARDRRPEQRLEGSVVVDLTGVTFFDELI